MNFVIFLAMLVALSRGSLLINSNCTTEICKQNLKKLVLALNPKINYEYLNNSFYIKAVYPLIHSTEASGLAINSYITKSSYGTLYSIDNFEYVNQDQEIHFNNMITTDEIKSTEGCINDTENDQSYTRKCNIVLEYMNEPTNSVIRTSYQSFKVEIPKTFSSEYSISDDSIYEENDEIVIDLTITYDAAILKQDCTTKITKDDKLSYGDEICLYLKGTDKFSIEYMFVPKSIVMTYKDKDDNKVKIEMSDVATIKCSLKGICNNGQTYAIMKLLVAGEMRFNMIVGLEERKRLLNNELSGSSFDANFEGSIIVSPLSGSNTEKESLSSSIIVSVLSFLVILILIL